MANPSKDQADKAAEVRAIFEQARKADIESVVGWKLHGGGLRMRGQCPLCGKGKGAGAGGPFSVNSHTGAWNCFSCQDGPNGQDGGDLVDLEHMLRGKPGETVLDAAKRLAGGELRAVTHQVKPSPSAEARFSADDWKVQLALRLWREAGEADRTPVETYLRVRGLFGPILAAMLRQVRYHPAAYHSGPWDRPVLLPAMVAAVRTPAGWTGGVHVTYLAPDGSGKTHRQPAKRMWGPQGIEDADGRTIAGACWLSHPAAPGPLVVGEGLESTGSAAILVGGPCRVVAALSLNRLQGGWKADRWGRRNLSLVEADPEAPAFTWPEAPAAPWGEVLIAVDRDMKPVEVRARKFLGGTYKVAVDSEARARICGSLATQNWRRTTAKPVRVIAPSVAGRDFNDELRARIANGSIEVQA